MKQLRYLLIFNFVLTYPTLVCGAASVMPLTRRKSLPTILPSQHPHVITSDTQGEEKRSGALLYDDQRIFIKSGYSRYAQTLFIIPEEAKPYCKVLEAHLAYSNGTKTIVLGGHNVSKMFPGVNQKLMRKHNHEWAQLLKNFYSSQTVTFSVDDIITLKNMPIEQFVALYNCIFALNASACSNALLALVPAVLAKKIQDNPHLCAEVVSHIPQLIIPPDSRSQKSIIRDCRLKKDDTFKKSIKFDHPIDSLAWSPDKTMLAVGLKGGIVQLFNAENNSWQKLSISEMRGSPSVRVAWSCNNDHLYVLGSKELFIFKRIENSFHPSSITRDTYAMVPDPRNNDLIWSTYKGSDQERFTLRTYNIQTLSHPNARFFSNTHPHRELSMSLDGKHLFASTLLESATITLFDDHNAFSLAETPLIHSHVKNNPHMPNIFSRMRNGELCIGTVENTGYLLTGHINGIAATAWSARGALASSDGARNIFVWEYNLETQRFEKTKTIINNYVVNSLAWSPDSSTLYAGTDAGILYAHTLPETVAIDFSVEQLLLVHTVDQIQEFNNGSIPDTIKSSVGASLHSVYFSTSTINKLAALYDVPKSISVQKPSFFNRFKLATINAWKERFPIITATIVVALALFLLRHTRGDFHNKSIKK